MTDRSSWQLQSIWKPSDMLPVILGASFGSKNLCDVLIHVVTNKTQISETLRTSKTRHLRIHLFNCQLLLFIFDTISRSTGVI